MKILLISPLPPPYGGIANWSQLVGKCINEQETIDLEALNIAPQKSSFERRSLWDRVVVQGFDMFKKKRLLEDIIKKKKVDIIHMTTSGQLAIIRDIMLLKVAKKKKIPIVYHIHFGRLYEISKRNTIEWKVISKAIKLSSVVITIDNTTNNCIVDNFPNVKTVYIPNPIDITLLPNPVEKSKKEIVFLGWNIKTKGVEELIQAWNIVGKNNPEYKLNLIGPIAKEYLLYLKSLAVVKNITFSGELSHSLAMEVLNESSIFILPSYTEGFPNVILEAMALRKPIIATKVGAIPDMLSGNCGVLINPKSVDNIINSLEGLLLDEERKITLSENAYKKVTNNYMIDKIYTQYKRVWDSILK